MMFSRFPSLRKYSGWFRGPLLVSLLFLLGLSASPVAAADLILSGSDVMIIENVTHIQTGNIIVRDSARLTIRNTTLIMNISYHEEFDIIVEGGATLEIIDSTVTTALPNEIQRIIMRGPSRLVFQGSNLTAGMAYLSFGAEGGGLFSGTATLTNSRLQNISLLFASESPCTVNVSDSFCNSLTLRFNNNFQGEFSHLKPGLFSSWSYRDNGYNISFENVEIYSLTAACDGPSQILMRNCEFHQFAPTQPSASIRMTAVDSRIRQIPLHGLVNIKASFQGLKNGHYDEWRLSDHAAVTSGELPVIELRNTDVLDWWGVSVFGGSEISIDDSTLEFRVYGNGSYAKLSNSLIKYRFMLYGATNSIVEFENAVVENIDVYVPPVTAAIRGTMTFAAGAQVTGWYGPATIKRTFPVQGDVADAGLTLYNGQGAAVWSGRTDRQGKAAFDVDFTDDNHREDWNLAVINNGQTVNKTINLLIATPIVLAGTYTVADVVMILRILSGISPSLPPPGLADIDGDGRIGLPEAVFILQKTADIR